MCYRRLRSAQSELTSLPHNTFHNLCLTFHQTRGCIRQFPCISMPIPAVSTARCHLQMRIQVEHLPRATGQASTTSARCTLRGPPGLSKVRRRPFTEPRTWATQPHTADISTRPWQSRRVQQASWRPDLQGTMLQRRTGIVAIVQDRAGWQWTQFETPWEEFVTRAYNRGATLLLLQ